MHVYEHMYVTGLSVNVMLILTLRKVFKALLKSSQRSVLEWTQMHKCIQFNITV